MDPKTNQAVISIHWRSVFAFVQLKSKVGAFPDAMASMRVVDLRQNQLSGTIPDVVATWPLEVCMFGQNKLSGAIPLALASLAQIQELILDHNELSGSVPDLVATKNVVLHGNKLTGALPRFRCSLNSSLVLKGRLDKRVSDTSTGAKWLQDNATRVLRRVLWKKSSLKEGH